MSVKTGPLVLLHAPVRKGTILEYAAHLSLELSALGLQVVLHVPADCEWPAGVPQPAYVVSNQRNPNVELKFGSPRWALNRFFLAFYNSWQRLRLAREVQADLLHLQLILPWVDGGFVRLHRRTARVIYTVHDVVPHVFKLPARVDRCLRRECYHLADGLIFHTAVNRAQFESVYSFLPSQTAVIPHGLCWRGPFSDADAVHSKGYLALPGERQIILMFGEVRPNKGVEVLIRAFAAVLAQAPQAFLLIAGPLHPSVNPRELQEQLQRLPPGSWEWRQGWISKDDLSHYFRAASVVALPYVAFTSQSGVLAQAYAYGRPVVVSEVGGLGATVREDDSGLVVSPSQPDELAGALGRLLTDSARWRRCQDNIARVAQEKYSWAQVARQTAAFYNSVLQN